MPVSLSRILAIALVAVASLLAGCDRPCPPSTALKAVSTYTGYEPEKMTYGEWVHHARLSVFLRDIVRAEGVASLEARHGFRCTPRPEAACSDCHTCTRAIRQFHSDVTVIWTHCVDQGDMQVRAEIGPGITVRAMSYWTPKDSLR